MDMTRKVQRIELRQRELVMIADGRDQVVCCEHGELWLTVDRQPADVILQAGESWPVTGQGAVVVSALVSSRLVIRPLDTVRSGGGAEPAASRVGSGICLESAEAS